MELAVASSTVRRDLVGRDEELEQLADLVARHPLVTLTGAPGVGKTHLATAFGDRLASEEGLPLLWCDLAGVGEVHAAGDVGAALAEQVGIGSVESLHATLDRRRHLLVVDGCELVPAEAVPFVRDLLERHPDIRVLATGRHPLGLDPEFVWVLPPLPIPDPDAEPPEVLAVNPAVAMYLARSESAGATRSDDPDQLRRVARLVGELDGLPLGIELAAARARTLGPGDLLARVDQQLDLLRAARGTARSPTASLRASLDLSYDALDPADAALLRSFSVFRGPVAADLVHAVCAADGTDDLDTTERLAALVDCSLLEAEPGSGGVVRYRLLNVVRRYAAGRLAAEGRLDAVEERCIDRLAAMADAFVLDASAGWTDELVGRMLGCFPTLVGAIELALRRDRDATRAFRLYLPLYSAVHGIHAAEVAALGAAIVQQWPDGDEPLRAEATAVMAAAHLFAGDAAAAVDLADSVLGSADASELAVLLACRTAGFSAWYQGDRDAALAHLDRGVALAERWGGPFVRELGVVRLAVRAAAPADRDTVIEQLGDLAVRCADAHEPVNHMWALVVLAHVLVRAGRLDEAEAVAVEALSVAEGLDHLWGRGASLRALAALDALRRGWVTSTPRWSAALAVHVEAGDRGAVAQTIDQAARTAASCGEETVAAALDAARLRGWAPSVLPPLVEGPPGGAVTGSTTSMAEAARRARAALAVPDPADPTNRATRVDQLTPATPGTPDQGDAGPAPPAHASPALRRDGDVWVATYGGRSVTVRHAKGLEDLARLLEEAGGEVHCLDLMGAAVVEPDTGAALDRTARSRYETRILELQTELDDAAANQDTAREELLTAELDALVDHLTRATARGGRDRRANATVERARAAVRWRLRAAIERLGAHHDGLGRHLDAAVRTGTWCSYRPERPTTWLVER